MSILDLEKTANHITHWIKDYAEKAGVKTLVLGLSGGIDSALVALLCRKTGLPTVMVNMPCHSSDSAYSRAKAFADDYGMFLTKVDLSSAHESIMRQTTKIEHPNFEAMRRVAVGGLRSCLRAPTLSYFANATSGIIMGTGNRSEDHITRYFQKFGDGCVDICPIADLFKSEVRQLFAHMAATMSPTGQMIDSAKSILDAKPTADLWGPDSGQEDEGELGISYDEIEWADREDMRTGIIFSDSDPAKYPQFFRYTARQQQVLAKLHQMEKISRHKFNPALPVCQLRRESDLLV